MATKNYMINDKWLDLDKQNIVELQSVDGVISSVKVNGEEYGGGGGGSWQTVFEDSVTTEVEGGAPFAEGNIGGLTNLSADSIKVTFNGTEYECNKIVQGGNNLYGGVGEDGPEFSQYPFTIMSSEGNGTLFFTQTAGTYTLKIEEPTT